MIFALAQPASLVGLLLAFLTALVLRAVVQRILARRLLRTAGERPLFQMKRDADIFGFVGALFGGTGWGRPAPIPDYYAGRRPHDAGRRAIVLLAAPVLLIALGEAILVAYLASAEGIAWVLSPRNVLVGLPGAPVDQVVLSFAMGLLCFGILDLVPLPPLDGWGLLRLAMRHEGTGMQKASHWLVDQNIGTAILVIGMLPLFGGVGLWVIVLDALATPLLLPWR